MKRVLIIQTAFLGDVILATPIIEKLYDYFPGIQIDFVVKKGNEGLLHNHPKLNKVFVFDKQNGKLRALFTLLKQLYTTKYDTVINLHRFASSGLITCLANTKTRIGFDKNPFSFCYNIKIEHKIQKGIHEVDRNLSLIQSITDNSFYKPKLYPSANDYRVVKQITEDAENYYCFAPTSVWFTKQLPRHKSIELLDRLQNKTVYLIGSKDDYTYCQTIIEQTKHKNVINLCGKLSLLQSAVLMQKAAMNFVNDSAPLHIAGAMNAPITVFYCSTVPEFGFGPLSDYAQILQVNGLTCKPCGLHGFKRCPQNHFSCGEISLVGLNGMG